MTEGSCTSRCARDLVLSTVIIGASHHPAHGRHMHTKFMSANAAEAAGQKWGMQVSYRGCRRAYGIVAVSAGGTTTVAYRDDELLEMKPRDKGAPCKRFVIELDATTPSSVSSSDFLIAASHPGSRILQFTPSSATSRGVHTAHTCCFHTAPLTHQPQQAASLERSPESLPHCLCRFNR